MSREVERVLRNVEGCVAVLFGLLLSGFALWLAYIAFLVWGHHG